MTGAALTRKLTLETRVRLEDGGGGAGEAWSELGALWAEVLPRAAAERIYGGVRASLVTHRIRMRWLPYGDPARPVAGQRLRDGARAYEVLGVTEADPHNILLQVWAREVAL
ncbi:MAG: head-tail adaptor protein [Rubrimonas sp.]